MGYEVDVPVVEESEVQPDSFIFLDESFLNSLKTMPDVTYTLISEKIKISLPFTQTNDNLSASGFYDFYFNDEGLLDTVYCEMDASINIEYEGISYAGKASSIQEIVYEYII